MKNRLIRFTFGLGFAILFGLATAALVQAEPRMDSSNSTDLDCQSCHPAFVATWENSAHGNAMSNTEFVDAWQEQEDDRDCFICHTTGYDPATHTWQDYGITCEACHNPITENHPLEPMSGDRSSELCGNCHIETLSAWQNSKHQNTGLACIDCHGQHSTALKADDATALCANCHVETASDFIHTSHNSEEASCADCHLELIIAQDGEWHEARDHSFFVKFNTCKACHNLSAAAEEINVMSDVPPDAMAAVATLGVSLEPDPVSPIYFVILSTLIGLAFGLVLAPWIERWFRKIDLEIKVDK